MSSLSQAQLKRLTSVHGWSGVILGFLLYAVVITGTVVVFANEISIWSLGGEQHNRTLQSGNLDSKVRPVLDTVPKGYLEEVSIFPNTRGNLVVNAHAHVKHPETGMPADYGPLFHLDAQTGDILSRHEGFARDHPEWFDRSALRAFLVDLHVQLYVPSPWGLILTGILGLMMMAAGVTGFLMHRHLIRDLFVAERPGKRLVSARDRHTLAASWSLPFAFLLGFTGAFFSFAISVGIPMMAMVAFGGDQEKMIRTLVNMPESAIEERAPTANLDRIIVDASARAGAPVSSLFITNYGRAGAKIRTRHGTADGNLIPVQYEYNGADGSFVREPPFVGKQPSTGNTLLGLMGPLHFGNFAGFVSKAAWVGLGAAMCFVILTGLRLWIRRREEQPLWRRFGHSLTIVAYGLPIAMLASGYMYFIVPTGAEAYFWTPIGFLIGAAGAIGAGLIVRDTPRLDRGLLYVTALGCAILPLFRMATGGTGWFEALSFGDHVVVSTDLFLILLGVGMAIWVRRERMTLRYAVASPAE